MCLLYLDVMYMVLITLIESSCACAKCSFGSILNIYGSTSNSWVHAFIYAFGHIFFAPSSSNLLTFFIYMRMCPEMEHTCASTKIVLNFILLSLIICCVPNIIIEIFAACFQVKDRWDALFFVFMFVYLRSPIEKSL